MQPDTTATAFGRTLRRAATEHPDGTCLIDGDTGYTYDHVLDLATAGADRLREAGVRPGDLVAVQFAAGAGTFVAIHSASLCGAPFMLMDPEWPARRSDAILQDARPIVVTTGDELIRGARLRPSTPTGAQPPRYPGTAYIIFTSGSSGRPKGVLVTDEGVTNLVSVFRDAYRLSPTDRVLGWAPWTFDASVADVVIATGSAAALVLADRSQKLPGDRLHRLLSDQQITAVTATPTALAMTEPVGPALHTVVSAGEQLSPGVAAAWLAGGRRMFNAYGPAEATVLTTLKRLSTSDDARSVGAAIANVQVVVRDPDGGPVVPGTYGEVWIAGANVSAGYIGADAPTDRFLSARADSGTVTRWYRSGDRGRIGPHGELELAGRLDNQVKLHGVRIELDDIDHAVNQLPQVRCSASCVVGTGLDASVVSYLVIDQPTDLRLEAVQSWLAERLPKYHVPREFRVVDELPTGVNGKVEIQALQVLRQDQWRPLAASSADGAALQGTELRLAAVWCAVLDLSSVGPDDDLFDLGGNSLKATRIVARISREIGADITIESLFTARTIARTAQLIDNQLARAADVGRSEISG